MNLNTALVWQKLACFADMALQVAVVVTKLSIRTRL